MSEKLYAWLLRLYPAHFRETYGEAALQLFRDRYRHERGLLPRLRLWLDLAGDLAISLPRQHRNARPAIASASVQPHSEGGPLFSLLEGEGPRPGALLLGGLLSITAVCGWVSLTGLEHYRPVSVSMLVANGTTKGRGVQQGVERDWQPVIRAAIANVKEYYVDPAVAKKMADALQIHLKNGDYDSAKGGAALAALLTQQMREISHDTNLIVVYRESLTPARPPGLTPEGVARYRKAMSQDNCTFEKVEILAHNIGYLKVNSFPDPSFCQATATAAMASLNAAAAIIFDLRDNTGGFPTMVAFIAAYLFDHPEYWYNPRENTTAESWTRSPVPGNKLADKPVYVLTSAETLSGAEQFSYDLKMLKRATIVGETTGGAAHAGVYHRIDEHFGMGIPEARAINPFSKNDWNGTGVEPDVKVKAEDALKTATKLAERNLRTR